MTFDLFKYMEEEEESNRGGGGLITQAAVMGGWFVFSKDKPEDRFFPYTNKEEGAAAKADALAYIQENRLTNSKGQKAKPFSAVRFTTYGGDSVLSKEEPVSWDKIDKYLVFFTEDFKEIFRGMSMPDWDAEYEFGEKIWVKISYHQSIDNPTWTDNDGEERPNLVPYIAQVYANKTEAEAAAFAMLHDGVVIEVPKQPTAYLYDDWDDFYRGMVAEFMKDEPSEEQISGYYQLADYGVTEAMVEHAKEQAKRLLEQDEIPF